MDVTHRCPKKARRGLNISSSPIHGFCHTSARHYFTPRNSTLIPLSSAHISDGSADSSQEFCWCLIECNLSYCTRDISWLWLCSNKCLCLCLRKESIFICRKVQCIRRTQFVSHPESVFLAIISHLFLEENNFFHSSQFCREETTSFSLYWAPTCIPLLMARMTAENWFGVEWVSAQGTASLSFYSPSMKFIEVAICVQGSSRVRSALFLRKIYYI